MPFDVYSQAGADAKFLTEVDGGDPDAAPLPITLRRGTTAQWADANPILAAGEPAVVLDSGQPAELVLGDGVTAMADLRSAVWDDDADVGAATAGQVRSLVLTDGTDQTATLQAELDALRVAGGGTLLLPVGTITLDGTITLGNDGATPPKQPAIRLVGTGAHWSGRGTAPVGGTILDIKGADTYGKIKSNGLGLLAMTGIGFRDSSGGTTPFLYTTNTTLMLHECAFIGSKTGAACDQDAIVLGGPNQIEGGGAWTDGFQGYGTVIERCFFTGIRTCIKGQAFANAVVIRDNTVWTTCGNANGAAIEWDGQPTTGSQSAAGCLIVGNLIEVPNYAYAIRLARCAGFTLDANNVFDKTATTLASVYLDAETTGVMVREGFTAPGLNPLVDNGTNTWYYPASQGKYATLPPAKYLDVNYPTIIRKLTVDGLEGMLVQPAASQSDSANIVRVLRSATEATNPGAEILMVRQNGYLIRRGTFAGNELIYNASDTQMTEWGSNGRAWSASGTGGPMSQDSGTGGSNFDHKNYAVRFYDHNGGPLRMRVGAGKDGFDLGSASDVTVQRDASGQLAVNKAVKTQSATTAGRPTAASVGAGAQIYDTTLSRPIWSDGSVWRDAAGTAV